MLYNINKVPVIILSSLRTGSTALTYDIFQQLLTSYPSLKLFIEPGQPDSLASLITSINNKDPYVLKLHAGDLIKSNTVKRRMVYSDIVKDVISEHNCCLIRIRRRDVIAQATSLYIAHQRKTYGYNQDTPYEKNVPNINIMQIHKINRTIQYFNKILDEYPATFDLDLHYEDLVFSEKINSIKTPCPDNYSLTYKLLKHFYP